MVAITDMVDFDTKGKVAVLTVDNPPVNALSQGVREGLNNGLKMAMDDSAIGAVVIVCRGRTFIAGADITEFGKPFKPPHSSEIFEKIESTDMPVIVAIHGNALGGGLEVSLTCHYRVAVASAKFGLPEVKLGLLPGGGGTQRLPRLVGPEKALEMIVGGAPIGSAEALEIGLIDEIVNGDLTDGAVAFAEKIVAEGRPLPLLSRKHEKVEAARGKPEIFANFRKSMARRIRGFDAPEACIQCVKAAVDKPFEEGINFEHEEFVKLMNGPQSAAQRFIFFAERQANKIPDVPKDTPEIPIGKVVVIGGGTMGGGISMNFANVGIPVTMIEVSREALDRGLGIIRRNYENTAKKGRISRQDVDDRMALISGSFCIEDVADADLVIEAVFENMDLKKEVFAKLDRFCKPGAILATNTSGLDVNEIAAVTGRPESVIGLHFFSPANVMRLIEVVRGEKTAKNVIATAMAMSKRIGKVAVLVGVCPYFVGNRMLHGRGREAGKLLLEGALPHQVDKVLFDFGFPMGQFAMADMAGLDIGWKKETSNSETIRDVLCEMDRRGQKTSAGFYDYDPGSRIPKPSPVVEKVLREFSEKAGLLQREFSDEEILARCIYPMINEGAKILEEGIAIRPGDIDVIWVTGYGWPVYRGGPMYYADQLGLDKVLAAIREFEAQAGEEWKPAGLLVKLAEAGKGFKDFTPY
ncbi:MAG: enoyl-CoA hydratase/isomerase family protein [Deltaproteobacteria bacterium]|nr:enoyl-CoA hydratase/isomerase family protein [Deltaproteobacteria bacterium]